MSTTIKLKKSGATGNVPTNTSLEFGELALNYFDGALYYKDVNNAVKQITGIVTNSFETINANGTLLIADSNVDILTMSSGDGIHITANALSDSLTLSVRFNDTVTSGNTNQAATANAVKTAYDQASAAYEAANNRVLKSGDTMTGNLTIAVNDTSNALRITQTGTGNAIVVEDETNPDATPFLVSNTGNVSIGTTNSSAKLHIEYSSNVGLTRAFNLIAEHSVDASSLFDYELYGPGNGSSQIRFKRATGTRASPNIANANHVVGRIGGMGYDGSDFYDTGLIRFVTDGTPVSNSMPGRIEFWTTSANSTVSVQRMRLDSTGNLGIGITSPTSTLHVVGTANVTSNVIVNGGTLFVDTTTNRVGVGITEPTSNLHVIGSANITTSLTVGGGAVLRSNNIYTVLIGDGANTTYNVTHSLDATSVFTETRNVASGAIVYPDINVVDANTINATFSIVPTTNQYRVSVFAY